MNHSAVATSDDHRYHLMLVISSLGAGGAQRVMATLANHWAAQGWSITLLTLDDGSQSPFFSLHAAIDHRPLNLYAVSVGWQQRLCNNLRRLLRLRQAIAASRPQAVVCFMDRTNVLVLCATLFLLVPVIVAEHTAIGAVKLGRLWEGLRRLVYPRAAAIVVLTERGRQSLPLSWQQRVAVIPNPVELPPSSGAVQTSEGKLCVAMGSLRAEKGFDLLLQSFAEVAQARPEWSLFILGDGPLRVELEQMSYRLGVGNRVRFCGTVAYPRDYLQAAELFVLSSRCEGFPLALCEAMACGLPVIAADCATGPREIVRPELDGLLVKAESVSELAAAMARLMDDEALRKKLGGCAPEVLERFSLGRVASRWDNLLHQVIDRP